MRDPGFAALLEEDEPLFGEEAHRRWLLSLPPFWPRADGALARRAGELREAPEARIGAVLLVGEHQGGGALFWLAPDTPPERLIPFRGEAREQLDLASRLVPRALPALVAPSALDLRHAGARRAVLSSTDPGALDGPSFGLALGIATASSLLDEPVPADTVALARLDGEGRCRDVGFLRAKIEILAGWALGVRRLLVAPGQAADARRLVDELEAPLTVEPVDDLASALHATFGDIESTLHRRWAAEPERAARAARALLSLARDGYHHLLDWRAVASAARGLADHLPPGEERWMAELAEHIANRHRSAPTPLDLHDAWLAAQPRPFRLKLWAHLVQSAADGLSDWRPLLAEAQAQLAPPGDEHPEDLALLGALGRAHAAWYEYGLATPLLERAARAWLALEQAAQATHPVAELLRIAAASHDRPLADRVFDELVPAIESDPATEPYALAFVHIAAARVRLGRGEVEQGASALARVELGPDAPRHLCAARLRWMACAARAQADLAGAAAALAALASEHAEDDGRSVALLARIEDALERGEDPAEAVAAAVKDALLGRELDRLDARYQPGGAVERAQLLTLHSRY